MLGWHIHLHLNVLTPLCGRQKIGLGELKKTALLLECSTTKTKCSIKGLAGHQSKITKAFCKNSTQKEGRCYKEQEEMQATNTHKVMRKVEPAGEDMWSEYRPNIHKTQKSSVHVPGTMWWVLEVAQKCSAYLHYIVLAITTSCKACPKHPEFATPSWSMTTFPPKL